MPKVRWSGKLTDTHSTATETAAIVIEALAKLDAVTKISLGAITHIGGGERRLKCLPITGGLKVVVRGSGAVQDLFVYTSDIPATQRQVEGMFR